MAEDKKIPDNIILFPGSKTTSGPEEIPHGDGKVIMFPSRDSGQVEIKCPHPFTPQSFWVLESGGRYSDSNVSGLAGVIEELRNHDDDLHPLNKGLIRYLVDQIALRQIAVSFTEGVGNLQMASFDPERTPAIALWASPPGYDITTGGVYLRTLLQARLLAIAARVILLQQGTESTFEVEFACEADHLLKTFSGNKEYLERLNEDTRLIKILEKYPEGLRTLRTTNAGLFNNALNAIGFHFSP